MTNSFTEITFETNDDTVTIFLHRPEALNAITPTMLAELNDALDAVAENSSNRFLIITGAGKAFSAGVDLKALGDRELVDGKVGDILRPSRAGADRKNRIVAHAGHRSNKWFLFYRCFGNCASLRFDRCRRRGSAR